MKYLGLVCAILFLVGFVYFTWYWGRKLQYIVGYEFLVKETVRTMVKEECLKFKGD